MADVIKYAASSGVWPTNYKDYNLRKVIGAGSISIVHQAYCEPRKAKCAIKRINLEALNEKIEELKELEALITCNHKNIVKHFTSFVVKNELWLVSRLLKGGSLLDIIKHKAQTKDCRDGVLDDITIATVLRKVLKALVYLHKKDQVHRDVRAENILVDKDGNVQIAAFGLNAWFAIGNGSQEHSRNSFLEKQRWMAPEIREKAKGYDFKSDVWNIGILAIELATGKLPLYRPVTIPTKLTSQNDSFIKRFVFNECNQFKNYGYLIKEMISECLQRDPEKRPTANELLKHPFFKKPKNRKFLAKTLLPYAPSIELRILKIINIKQLLGTNGWRYRPKVGKWVWSPYEEETEFPLCEVIRL